MPAEAGIHDDVPQGDVIGEQQVFEMVNNYLLESTC